MILKASVEGKGREVGAVPSPLPAASGRCATSGGFLTVGGGGLLFHNLPSGDTRWLPLGWPDGVLMWGVCSELWAWSVFTGRALSLRAEPGTFHLLPSSSSPAPQPWPCECSVSPSSDCPLVRGTRAGHYTPRSLAFGSFWGPCLMACLGPSLCLSALLGWRLCIQPGWLTGTPIHKLLSGTWHPHTGLCGFSTPTQKPCEAGGTIAI